MKTIRLPDGTAVPALGQGTWMLGQDYRRRANEIAALRVGVELGMSLIDTAEMYGDGTAEELVGEALGSVRDEIFLVSKPILRMHRASDLNELATPASPGSAPIGSTSIFSIGAETCRSPKQSRRWSG